MANKESNGGGLLLGLVGAAALAAIAKPAAADAAPLPTPIPANMFVWLGNDTVVMSGPTIADTDFPTPGRSITVLVDMPELMATPPDGATHAHLTFKRAYHGSTPYGLTAHLLDVQFNTEFSAYLFPIGGGALQAMTASVIYHDEPLFADNPRVLLEINYLRLTS